MIIAGRIAWDREAEHWSPWLSFKGITAYRTWCRDMRKALGFRARAEYIYIDCIWTAPALLESTRCERGRR